MSTGDPDGRMLQAVKDAHESLDKFLTEFIAELSGASDDVQPRAEDMT